MRIICWIKGIYYTARRPDFWFDGLPISGCDFVEQKDGSLKCKVCGLMSKAKRWKNENTYALKHLQKQGEQQPKIGREGGRS